MNPIETTPLPQHNIARSLAHLIERMQTSDDPEVTVEFYEAVEAAGEQFTDHLQELTDVVDTLEGTIVGIDYQIMKMQNLKMEREQRAARLRTLIQQWMETVGTREILLPRNTLRCTLNPPSVNVYDETMIPAEYMRTPEPKPVVPVPDKRAIGDALKNGIPVMGCELQQKTTLRIA